MTVIKGPLQQLTTSSSVKCVAKRKRRVRRLKYGYEF